MRTADNRDYCGIGLCNGTSLCIVLDGSSSGKKSGEFARRISRSLIDWFIIENNVTASTIVNCLRHIHRDLSAQFRGDSASFLIALLHEAGAVQLLHAGDCLAGVRNDNAKLSWKTQPHTFANALIQMPVDEIARSPLRNRITRSFRSREFMVPDLSNYVPGNGEMLVLATDGFWAALSPQEQMNLLNGAMYSSVADQDDCSLLSLEFVSGGSIEVNCSTPENLYLLDGRE